MVRSRFARRGPSKATATAVVVVGVVAVLGGLFAYALTIPGSLPPGELYSGESGSKASVFIPGAQWNPKDDAIELSAIVTVRIDSSASCSVSASNGAVVRTARVDAIADAATMTCANMSIPLRGAERGDWTVIVTYTAPQFTAESEPMSVEVGS